MTDQKSVCAYKHCLHHGQGVKASESVVINNKYYHWDCAEMKQKIQDCADTYVGYTGDKSQYPAAMRIINTLVFKNEVPIDFIKNNIETSRAYYAKKPVQILFGLRKLYWERNFKM